MSRYEGKCTESDAAPIFGLILFFLFVYPHGAKHSPLAHAFRSTEGRIFGVQRKFMTLSELPQNAHSVT